EDMDSRTIFLSRMSFGQTDVPVWKRQQFKNISYDQYSMLKRTASRDETMCFNMWIPSQNLRYKDNLAEFVQMQATTEDYIHVDPFRLAYGRYFNEYESVSGAHVMVLGYDVAETLFEQAASAINQEVRVFGKQLTVIGVIEKQG